MVESSKDSVELKLETRGTATSISNCLSEKTFVVLFQNKVTTSLFRDSVIMPKDPINSELENALRTLPLPPELTEKIYRYSQDAWIEEIATLMGDLYDLFVKMRYLGADEVWYPPYSDEDFGVLDMDLIAKLGVSDDVVSLIQQLPYVYGRRSEDDVFFKHGGVFLDYRDNDQLEQSRDPLYLENGRDKDWSEDGGPYMRPWYACLNEMGNHGPVMIISMRSRMSS